VRNLKQIIGKVKGKKLRRGARLIGEVGAVPVVSFVPGWVCFLAVGVRICDLLRIWSDRWEDSDGLNSISAALGQGSGFRLGGLPPLVAGSSATGAAKGIRARLWAPPTSARFMPWGLGMVGVW
jgi:hypothetical protein